MIIGIGSDLADIRRVERSIARFGERFTGRCFTDAERQRADAGKNRAASYAKRFAAKEALSKALGTGMSQGVFWKDIGVINSEHGKPSLVLTGATAELMRSMTPAGHEAVVHLTMTDEFPYAQAFVVIEARPVAR